MKHAFVYMLASTSRTLYTGVTSDLVRRVWQHKTHAHDGFTTRYDVTKLVWFAEFARIDDAIAYEKSLKGKSRAKKIALSAAANPRCNDLAWNWYATEEIHDGTEVSPSRISASPGDSSLRSE